MAKKNWIQNAIQNPGSFTAKAKKAGAVKNGKIEASFTNAKAKLGGAIGKQARLAKTLKGFKKGK